MRASLSACVCLLVVTLLPAPTRAAGFNVEYHETISDFSQIIIHHPVSIDDLHDVMRGTFWEVHTVLLEDNDTLANDYIAVSTFARHTSGPHTEAANPAGVSLSADVHGEDTDLKWISIIGDGITISHESHYNLFDAELLARLSHFLGIDQITGYIWMTGGMHTDDPNTGFSVYASLTSTEVVPPHDGESFGGLMLQYDRNTQLAIVSLPVADMMPDQILGAELYLGPPGVNGSFLLSLGTGLDFTALGTSDSMLYTRDVLIPTAVIDELLAGNVYALLRTQQYPNGELRGQFSASAVPEPGIFILAALGLLSLGCSTWRRLSSG